LRAIAHDLVRFFEDSIRRYSDPFTFELLLGLIAGDTSALIDLEERPQAYEDVARAVRWGSVVPEVENYAGAFAADRAQASRRSGDTRGDLVPPWSDATHDRRHESGRDYAGRRSGGPPATAPLSRSRYERVFINLGKLRPLTLEGTILRPVAVKGWYHAIFERANGDRELIAIDQLADLLDRW
jgi:hypothetical protein